MAKVGVMPTFRTRRGRVIVVGLAFLGLAAAGCSSSSSSSSSAPASSAPTSASASSSATGTGSVNVIYAGSLVNLMTKALGPAFTKATGYSVTGESGGSTALATSIKGKVYKGDVFVSASPKADKSLMGASNGSWVSWYGTFATSGVVLGYNPKSKFAADIKSKPWYQVITEPGLKLGFTDPATDPKGELVAEALTDTAKSKNLPALTKLEADKGDVYEEQTLVARLQEGQLDAAFVYTAEATPAKIPTVPLTGLDLKATYTVSVLKGAPNQAGAQAFVSYLLGSNGQSTLKSDGFSLVSPPTVTGTGVPSSLASLFS